MFLLFRSHLTVIQFLVEGVYIAREMEIILIKKCVFTYVAIAPPMATLRPASSSPAQLSADEKPRMLGLNIRRTSIKNEVACSYRNVATNPIF